MRWPLLALHSGLELNEAPALHKYNVCFNLKSQKLQCIISLAFAALSNSYC